MKRLVVASVLALFAPVFVASSSGADPGTAFDVYAVQVSDMRVSSNACRSIPITLLHDGPVFEDAWARVEVWRGQSFVESAALFDFAAGRISGSMNHCPSFEGLGRFRAGPSDVDYVTTDFATSGEFRDGTTASFSVLQDARVSKVRAKRSGKKITLTGKSSWYSVRSSKWLADPKGWKFKLQRQTPRGVWRTVKSARVGKKGFKVSTSQSGRANYRIVTSAGKDTWPGVSKVVRR